MVDELAQVGGVSGLTKLVATLVTLPVKDFGAQLPSVEIKSVPKKKVPTDSDAGDDAIDFFESDEVEQRPIVIPPLVRRAVSIHLSEILDATGDGLLPNEAIAYRQGRARAVQRAILDVASTVRNGFSHWITLDVRSFFPAVPWTGIEATLTDYGYSEEFTKKTMVMVMGKLEKRSSWRTWVPVHNEAGTQAGLRESSILANLFLSRLDRRLLARFKEDLFYRRYSDDMLLMGKTKKVVRHAVVEVEDWIESRGLHLKGIGP